MSTQYGSREQNRLLHFRQIGMAFTAALAIALCPNYLIAQSGGQGGGGGGGGPSGSGAAGGVGRGAGAARGIGIGNGPAPRMGSGVGQGGAGNRGNGREMNQGLGNNPAQSRMMNGRNSANRFGGQNSNVQSPRSGMGTQVAPQNSVGASGPSAANRNATGTESRATNRRDGRVGEIQDEFNELRDKLRSERQAIGGRGNSQNASDATGNNTGNASPSRNASQAPPAEQGSASRSANRRQDGERESTASQNNENLQDRNGDGINDRFASSSPDTTSPSFDAEGSVTAEGQIETENIQAQGRIEASGNANLNSFQEAIDAIHGAGGAIDSEGIRDPAQPSMSGAASELDSGTNGFDNIAPPPASDSNAARDQSDDGTIDDNSRTFDDFRANDLFRNRLEGADAPSDGRTGVPNQSGDRINGPQDPQPPLGSDAPAAPINSPPGDQPGSDLGRDTTDSYDNFRTNDLFRQRIEGDGRAPTDGRSGTPNAPGDNLQGPQSPQPPLGSLPMSDAANTAASPMSSNLLNGFGANARSGLNDDLNSFRDQLQQHHEMFRDYLRNIDGLSDGNPPNSSSTPFELQGSISASGTLRTQLPSTTQFNPRAAETKTRSVDSSTPPPAPQPPQN